MSSRIAEGVAAYARKAQKGRAHSRSGGDFPLQEAVQISLNWRHGVFGCVQKWPGNFF